MNAFGSQAGAPAYGCIFASWTASKFVHPDVTFQGNNGSWTTIASDEYDVHSALGALVKREYDNDGNAVDWSSYTSFRATYWVYNPSTNASTQYSTETQTVAYQDFGIAPYNPVSGVLSQTAAPYGQFLAGDYLSLGAAGTRPTDATHGTGIWADVTGIYGLNANTQQFYLDAATGKAYAGAGAVTLDSTGVAVLSPTSFSDINSFKFVEAGGTIDALWQHYNNATTKNESLLKLNALTGLASIFELNAAAPSTKNGQISLHTTSGTLDAYIQLTTTSSSTSRFYLLNDSLAIKFQVDLVLDNVVCNSAAIATNATDGFLYIASCAGTPTGTPTTYTGRAPMVIDSTNNKLYIYSGGAWVAVN